jgi:archaellum component FlaC
MTITAKDIFEGFRKAAVEVLVPEIRETNARIDALRERMDERFTKMDDRFAKMDDRLRNVEVGLADIRGDLRGMTVAIHSLTQVIEARFDVQEKIDRRLTKVEDEVVELRRKAG